MAGELDDRALQAQAEAQVRDPVLAGVARGEDLALDPAVAEAARDEDAGRARRAARRRSPSVSVSESTQRTFTSTLVRPAGVLERLGDRQVGVGQLDVLADEGDLELRLGALDPLDEVAPVREVGRRCGRAEAEVAHDELAEAGFLEHERDLVDRLGGLGRDDRLRRDVGEEGDLLADLVGDRVVRAQDDDVGLDADPAQLLDGVLGRLRLQLAGRLRARAAA